MHDDACHDDLERYLSVALVIDVGAFPAGGAHAKHRVILEGGVTVLAKPEDGIGGDGARIIRQEAAAWILARELGWSDLVAATVLRPIDFGGGREVMSSVQVVWAADNLPDAPVDTFRHEDTLRAAVFDVLVQHSDRGHNWLAVPASESERRLKLVDHGYAFGVENRGFQSAFYNRHKGDALPDEYLSALAAIDRPGQRLHLEYLLEGSAWAGVQERASWLRENGVVGNK